MASLVNSIKHFRKVQRGSRDILGVDRTNLCPNFGASYIIQFSKLFKLNTYKKGWILLHVNYNSISLNTAKKEKG